MKRLKFLICLLFALPLLGQGDFYTLEDGTKLYVAETGEGQPMIFIPGWTMTYRFFEKQQAHFAKKFHVIAYDPRGQGRADKTTYKNHYAAHAADLREFILEKELNDIILVGWSNGCLTQYEYLRTYGKDRISKFVFIDEPPKWVGNPEKEWVYGDFDGYRNSLKRMLSTKSDPNGIIDWMLKDSLDTTTRNWMREEILMTPPHVALSLYIDGLACDYTDELKNLDAPSLFLIRESWFEQAKTWLSTNVPKAEVKSISSHAMFWERPETFNQLLEQFINQN